MPNYGVVERNIIVNVIVAENKEIAETVTGRVCVELPHYDVGAGWTYEGGNFFAPIEPEQTTSADTQPTA
jgi:hypothetical protein